MSDASKNNSDGAAARKERVARWSIFASLALTLGKFAAGILSGSLALLSEAAHSLIDTGATIVTWIAVRVSNKPADAEHHYGHGKIESVAALAEMFFLIFLALGVLAKAAYELHSGNLSASAERATPVVFAVVVISIVIDINRIRALSRVARATGSHALAADAVHFASDLAGSTFVLLGLIALKAGFVYGDALAAVGVAVFIAIAGWRLGRRTLDTLLDAAPKEISPERLRALALATPGIVNVAGVRLRSGGNEIFGEMSVEVSRALSLDQVGTIKENFIKNAGGEFSNLALTVTATPIALPAETVRDRVLLLAQRNRLPVHHVTVQELAGKLSISLDMEIDGRKTLAEAHERAEFFKKILRAEFGEDTEVEPHVEPLETLHLAGRDTSAEFSEKIAEALKREAEGSALIGEIHNVRARMTPNGIVVNYHCRADGALDVASVHRHMDEIEHHVRDAFPVIHRIVGHADVLRRLRR